MALTKDQQNIIGGVGFGVVVVFFLIWKIYMPMGKEITVLKKTKTDLNQQISTLKIKAQQRDKLQREYELLELEVKESQKQLPRDAEMDDLLRLITNTAQKIGIYIKQFTPGNKTNKNYYDEIPIKLDVSTDYHSLAKFLVDLGQSERIISAKDISMRKESGQDFKYTVVSNFSLVTYMAK